MPDISLRFNKDMLVVSAPAEDALARMGANVKRDMPLISLMESDSIVEALRLEGLAGAQCIVAPTAFVTPARMAHSGWSSKVQEIVDGALGAVEELNPQHLLVEVGPCELPLDGSSKESLVENRDQYARAAHLFDGKEFDAFFLNGFKNVADIKCALMGVRMVSAKPIILSVDTREDGLLASGRGTLEEAAAVAQDLEADVFGFKTAAAPDLAVALARRVIDACELPVMVQLEVKEVNKQQGYATDDNPYFDAEEMVGVAARLRAVGVQFLRAVGEATPSYTGALMVATMGADVNDVRGLLVSEEDASPFDEPERKPALEPLPQEEIEEIAADVRARIAAALKFN